MTAARRRSGSLPRPAGPSDAGPRDADAGDAEDGQGSDGPLQGSRRSQFPDRQPPSSLALAQGVVAAEWLVGSAEPKTFAYAAVLRAR